MSWHSGSEYTSRWKRAVNWELGLGDTWFCLSFYCIYFNFLVCKVKKEDILHYFYIKEPSGTSDSFIHIQQLNKCQPGAFSYTLSLERDQGGCLWTSVP